MRAPHHRQHRRPYPAVSEYLSRAGVEAYGLEKWGLDELYGRVVGEWTGIMGFSIDWQPLFGKTEGKPGVWLCAGFKWARYFHGVCQITGSNMLMSLVVGMALASRCAEALVSKILGNDDEEL